MSTIAGDLMGLHVPKAGSDMLSEQIHADRLPQPVRAYQFHPKWRLSLAWPSMRLGVEIGERIEAEKLAVAILADWTVLPVTARHIRNGQAIAWVKALLWERRGL